MPKYVFECQNEICNLRFERTLKMGDHFLHECPSCHEDAPQVVEGFSFDFKEPAVVVPGNTGVHKDDYPTADRVVGKDAEKRWGEYRARDVVKQKVREVGRTHALVRQNAPDGSFVEYTAMNDTGRQLRRETAQKAVAALRRAGERKGRR